MREVPSSWEDPLHGGDAGYVAAAARLRDELHAVANRVARLLVAPGSAISRVHIEVPTALSRGVGPDLLLALLRLSAERLARLTDALAPDDWDLHGYIGSSTVTIGELVVLPLHASYRHLSARTERQGVDVITLADHRRRTGVQGDDRVAVGRMGL